MVMTKNPAMKIVLILWGLVIVVATAFMLPRYISAKIYESYDKINAEITSASDMVCNYTQHEDTTEGRTLEVTYNLKVTQPVEYRYTQDGAEYTGSADVYLGGGSFDHMADRDKEAENAKEAMYKVGDTIEVYAKGEKSATAQEINMRLILLMLPLAGNSLLIIIYILVLFVLWRIQKKRDKAMLAKEGIKI